MVGLVGTGALFPTPKERVIEDIISFELITIPMGIKKKRRGKEKPFTKR